MNQQEIKHPEEPHTTGCHLSATSQVCLSGYIFQGLLASSGTLGLNYVGEHDSIIT